MSGRDDQLQMFQMVTGASVTKARQYLQETNWNAELSLSNWFERGEQTEVVNPLALPENQPKPVQQVDLEVPTEEFIGTLPGLYANDTLVPLKAIDVRVNIVHFIADVEVTQRFVNQTNKSIEAVFKFENYNAALTNFEVEVDGKVFKGLCKDKTEAINDYDDAIASGYGAYILEKGKKEDIFKISVGNLPPNKECRLSLRYVMELDIEDNFLKFVLPITRTRLLPVEVKDQEKHSISGMAVTINLKMPSPITEIKSNTHQINSTITGQTATVFLRSQTEVGKEFQVLFKLQNPHVPVSFVEVFSLEGNNLAKKESQAPIDPDLAAFGPQPGFSFFSLTDFPQPRGGFIGFEDPSPTVVGIGEEKIKTRAAEVPHAVMVSLFPHLETDDDTITEIIFLVDRSGSMAGSRINQAKNALQLFLRSLPQGTLFNIVGFGSTFEKLFPSSVQYNDVNLSVATTHVSNMKANLGGTNILAPLQNILSTPVHPNFPRQVFCLTDGEVENTDKVLRYVKNNLGNSCRIFTFGIGAEASKTLVRGIAKYGRGKEEFIVSGERMEGKVMKQLRRTLMPILKNVTIDWGGLPLVNEYSEIEQIIPPIFEGEHLVLYNFITGTEQFGKRVITISGTTGEQNHKWEIPVDFESDTILGSHVHRLTANHFIRSLEVKNPKQNREKIVRLGQNWGLVTKYTSYIAVEERDFHTEGTTELQKVNVLKQIQKNVEEQSTKSSAKLFNTNKSNYTPSIDNDIFDDWSDDTLFRHSPPPLHHSDNDISDWSDDNSLFHHSPPPLHNTYNGISDCGDIDDEIVKESLIMENCEINKEADIGERLRAMRGNVNKNSKKKIKAKKVEKKKKGTEIDVPEKVIKSNLSWFPFMGDSKEQTKGNKEKSKREDAIREQKKEREKIAREHNEKERITREQAERERIAREHTEKEKIAREAARKEHSELDQFLNQLGFNDTVIQIIKSYGVSEIEDFVHFGKEDWDSLALPPFQKNKIMDKISQPNIPSQPSPSLKQKSYPTIQTSPNPQHGPENIPPQPLNIPQSAQALSTQVAKPEVEKTAQTRPLDIFILQQNASGAFMLNDVFLTAANLKQTKQQLLDVMPQMLQAIKECDLTLKEIVWATTIALIVLEQKFKDLEVEWALISDKSRKFITKTLKPYGLNVSDLLKAARLVL